MIRRLLAFALLTLVACPQPFGLSLAADAQQPASPRRIGVLLAGSWTEEMVQAFEQGLKDAGYVEGRDVVTVWRRANGNYGQLPQLATDLVQSKVDVIVVSDTFSARAAERATSTIPIVMATAGDPVEAGLVSNLAHPGGNITGLTQMITELSAKRLQLLKQVVPRLNRVAVLWNPDNPYHLRVIEELKAPAQSLSMELSLVSARAREELNPAFSAASKAHAQALFAIGDGLFFSNRSTLINLAARARLPAVYGVRQYVEEGGLFSYGPDLRDLSRRSAGYVDKILKGAKPGDLPIEQPTKFELVVNLKTAKALAITVPESILLRADEVIR